MSTIALPRRVAVSTVLVAAVGALAVAALMAQRIGGADGYLTDPLASGSWAAAAVLADVARIRLADAGRDRAARSAGALSVSLLVGLVAGVAAVAAASARGPLAPVVIAPVVIALWSVTWIPPLALSQLAASSAVRTDGRRSPAHAIVLATSSAGMLAGLALWRPSAPFVGVATIAPDDWPTRVAVVGDIVSAVAIAGLLVLPVTLVRAALTSRDRSRTRLALAAAGTAAAPVVVVFCVLLAIARDPGDVDPTAGSVAFLVAVAGGAVAATVCAMLAGRGPVDAGRLAVAFRIAALAVGALVVAAVGTLVAAAGLPPTGVALLIAGVAVAAAATAWWGGGRLAVALAAPADESHMPHPSSVDPPTAAPARAADPRLAQLTDREAEVLSLLADGSSNAGIAAQLVVSERTVDAHLRSVFTKLELHQDPAANRRVQAARQWLRESISTE